MERQLSEVCPYCEGKGHIKSFQTVCNEVLREIRRQASNLPGDRIVVCVHPEVADLLASTENEYMVRLEQNYDKDIVVEADANFHVEQFEIHVNVTPPEKQSEKQSEKQPEKQSEKQSEKQPEKQSEKRSAKQSATGKADSGEPQEGRDR